MRLPWESEGLKLKIQNFVVWQELEHQLVHGEGGEERSAYSGELIDKVIQLLHPVSTKSCRMLAYFIFLKTYQSWFIGRLAYQAAQDISA